MSDPQQSDTDSDPDEENGKVGRAPATQPLPTPNTSVPEDPVSSSPDDTPNVDPRQSPGPARQDHDED